MHNTFPELNFDNLHSLEGLKSLDEDFLNYVYSQNYLLCKKLIEYRQKQADDSNLILELAPFLEEYLVRLFKIEEEFNLSLLKHKELDNVYKCKMLFVQKRVSKKSFDLAALNLQQIETFLDFKTEMELANKVIFWLEDEEKYSDNLEKAELYTAWALFTKEGRQKHDKGVLFHLPRKVNYDNLFDFTKDGESTIRVEHIKERSGFSLHNELFSLEKALDQANYCLWCHKREKDSCSKGLTDKVNVVKINELGNKLNGCPLKQHISEMNMLKSQGNIIGALSAIMINNPLVAATGSKICNDCSKACIYQKQEPVDIPNVETKILDDVLNLSYGFEIYALLTRWNPLKQIEYLPKPNNGYNVLIAGQGPAGFTMAYYLAKNGCNVLAIDGLKIEKLNKELLNNFIINAKERIFEDLDSRVINGFGGVAEYGITNRWNKNYLTLIRIILERNANYSLLSGLRLGSNLSMNDVKEMGFDHVVLAIGAGKPNLINIDNMFVRGSKTSSDFLMNLQLAGAFKKDVLSALQIRMPIIVIGGGLTAVDSATEALFYYQRQLDKVKNIYDIANKQNLNLDDILNQEEKIILEEFLTHKKMLDLADDTALKRELIRSFGGVKIVYRKSMQESPSYRLNAEELKDALEQGVEFIENAESIEFLQDEYGHLVKIRFQDTKDKSRNFTLEAKSLIIATGTKPNISIANEYKEIFKTKGDNFLFKEESKFELDVNGKFDISVIGDSNPSYAGSVVKAMASAKDSYKQILDKLSINKPKAEYSVIKEQIQSMRSYVYKVNILSENIVELIVKSDFAARNFQPGQFFRLQNFEHNTSHLALNNNSSYKRSLENMAVTGAYVDEENGLLSLIILEVGFSTKLVRNLKEGEEIILMGPTGTPTYIPKNEKVILIGGGLGNAVLFSIGDALKKNGCDVTYFAAYRDSKLIFMREKILEASDKVIWCLENGDIITNNKESLFRGNVVEALKFYAAENNAELSEVKYFYVIGSDGMMNAVNDLRQNILRPCLHKEHNAIASINSPMQCMMKEICGQCIQEHIDPVTGLKSYVYSCVEQDQDMNKVNFNFLRQRLKQNSLLEKLHNLMLDV